MPDSETAKIGLKNAGSIEGTTRVADVSKRLNDAALKACRLNGLTANTRTRLERIRFDSLNASNTHQSEFEPSPYSKGQSKDAAFIAYASYWYGYFRSLKRAWDKKQAFNKMAWGKLTKVVKLMEHVADNGLDALVLQEDEKTHKFMIKVQ